LYFLVDPDDQHLSRRLSLVNSGVMLQ